MTTKPKIKLLYVGYMECLENWSKVGITSDSFEARWKSHNSLFPAPARMRKSSSGAFWLREEDARVIEKQVKARWSDTAEWVKKPHEDLETIIEGLIARGRFKFWRRKPKNPPPASPSTAAVKKPSDNSDFSDLIPPKRKPGEERRDHIRRLRAWRVENGLCYTCGKVKVEQPRYSNCPSCIEKNRARRNR